MYDVKPMDIIDCLHEVGINVEYNGSPLYLKDIIIDSVLFIAFVVELEKKYDFEIPDEYLNIDELESIDEVCNIINILIND